MVFNASTNYPLVGSQIPSEGDWWRFFKNYIPSGIVNDGAYSNPLQALQVGGGTTLQVLVGAGRAIVEGFYAEWGTNTTVTIAGNVSGSTRIDVIVAEIDFTNHRADITVVQGTPGGGTPGLTQLPTSSAPPLAGVTQIPLAVITVLNGATGIGTANIQDCRTIAGNNAVYGGSLASAATLSVPALSYLTRPAEIFLAISGTTTITSIIPAVGALASVPIGTTLRLKFLSAGCALSAGTLTDTFTSAVSAMLSLQFDGTGWVEFGRSNARSTQNLIYATPAAATGVPTLRAMVDADIPTTLTGKTFSGICAFQAGWTSQSNVTMSNAQAIYSLDSGAVARRMLVMSAGNVVQFGNIDQAANVEIYRGGVKAMVVGSTGASSGIGTLFGTGVAAPAYVCDVDDSWAASQLMRVWNVANSSTAGALIVGSGTNAGGQIMNIYNVAAGTNIGNITHNGTVTTYATTSDKRLKQAIQDAEIGLDQIKKMRVRTWEWKHDTEQTGMGFVAQELQKIAPEAVAVGPDGLFGIDYGKLTPYCVAAIQDLAARIEKIEGKKDKP